MITPREYISHSQKKLWKQNPDRYIDLYLYDGKKFESTQTRFGSKVAHSLEFEEDTGDVELDAVIEMLPKFELMDQPSNAEIVSGKKKVQVHGRMDTRKGDHSAFKEYKTGMYSKEGKPAWTQRKVDEDKQITFYAMICYLLTKKVPEDIELVWAVTDWSPHDENTIILTGEVNRFRTKRTLAQVIEEMADTMKVWDEIVAGCKEELSI
jgi:hypothetical protein